MRPASSNSRESREAYRLLFPLGVLASLLGVLLWPALYAGWLTWYPLEAHTRLMTACFGGCFVVGFLGTAVPRLVDAPPIRPAILLVQTLNN